MVPDLHRGPPSTPAVLRARTPREFQAITRDPDPVPTALREFRRSDRLLIRFFANVPGGASSADVATRLLNRVGQKMVDLATEGHKISIRFEMELCRPLGIASYMSEGCLRNIQVRQLKPEEVKAIPVED
jgi:hypothetical protein